MTVAAIDPKLKQEFVLCMVHYLPNKNSHIPTYARLLSAMGRIGCMADIKD